MKIADYVIVGAGSAGCALAHRIAEDGRYSVIVIEHGGTDWGPFIQMPAALSYPMNMGRYDWGYQSMPEPNMGGRRLACPRGKVLGGSSSVNGMVYVRGHPCDFDTWEEMGAAGWGFRHVQPYFHRMETAHLNGAADGSSWRGGKGPLHVTRGKRWSPLFDAFIESGAAAGYQTTDDYNGAKQEGFGPMERTIWRGRRWSAANAYLRTALKSGRAKVQRGLACNIVIRDGRACGVNIRRFGRTETIKARREVILAASAINSPKLLMLSGIGPAGHLRQFGIDVLADRPGVGGNLQDHLEIYLQMNCRKPVTLNRHFNLISKALIGARWLFLKSGHGATNHFEAAGFIRSAAGIEYPDIQFHFLPAAARYDGTAVSDRDGFQVHVGPMRSKSRGTVRLASGRSDDAPEIRFNYMSHPDDWEEFRKCIRLAREILAQEPLAPYADGELSPGADVVTDAQIDAFISEHAESAYHPCGTCRMGATDDPEAVVDPHCRVIGIDGLRVADSSIFPQITNGNLNGPSIMVGEKAADHILGRDPLPASNLEPWISPAWQTSQR